MRIHSQGPPWWLSAAMRTLQVLATVYELGGGRVLDAGQIAGLVPTPVKGDDALVVGILGLPPEV